MSDYVPVYTGGTMPFTATAGATITGGQLVYVSATGLVVTPTAAARGDVVGVAASDAASGATLAVWPLVGPVHETVTPAGVTAGDALTSTSAGGVMTAATSLATAAAAGIFLGTALTTATTGLKTQWTAR
jgi:hypothetical protein